jgi:hypothetical protein
VVSVFLCLTKMLVHLEVPLVGQRRNDTPTGHPVQSLYVRCIDSKIFLKFRGHGHRDTTYYLDHSSQD